MNYTNVFTDMFKNSQDLFKNQFDYNQLLTTQRRNVEAATEASQNVVESIQAISRRQTEIVRESIEGALKASKDIFTSGTPETNLAKQTEFAKSAFGLAVANLREVSEMAAKSAFEAFDVVNRRVSESMEEVSKASGAAPTATSKKKAA